MTNDMKEVKEAVIEKALNDMDVLAKEEKEIFRVDTDTFLFSGVEGKDPFPNRSQFISTSGNF